jgi:hypothetical protein
VFSLAPVAGAARCPPLSEVVLNCGFARAVLEGLVPGRLWVDDLQSPRIAHAVHCYGMSLVWGNGPTIDPLIEHLRAGDYRKEDEWLQIDPRWTSVDWDERLGTAPYDSEAAAVGPQIQRFNRINFKFDRKPFLARPERSPIPQGWSLRPANARDFELTGMGVAPRAFWRDAEHFIANGGGVCAVKDNAVGAIAFASFRFDNELEIGIETRMPFRGLGLARAVAVAIIERCVADGLEPIWACRRENAASYLLALQLGFVVTRSLPYYRLPALVRSIR